MAEEKSAFDAPPAAKTAKINLKDGTTLEVNGQFTTIVRYARKAADGSGENAPYVLVEVAGTDPVARKAIHHDSIATIDEVK